MISNSMEDAEDDLLGHNSASRDWVNVLLILNELHRRLTPGSKVYDDEPAHCT